MTQLTTSEKPGNDFLSRPLLASLNLDWEKGIYIAFILLGIITRFWGLGDRVTSHDESLHTQYSYQFYRGDGFQHTPLMHGPFLFHMTALSYWLFGPNDFTARIPVAILGVLLIALAYMLRPYLGRIGALFTSFIFLISPYLLYYTRYIREDIFAIIGYMLVFIFILYYLDRREEKYLWLFAGALSYLFITKEVSFFYVAIFGSFLTLRLLPQIATAAWFAQVRGRLLRPALVVLVGLVLLGGGFVGHRIAANGAIEAATPESSEPFAADPEQDTAVHTAPSSSRADTILRWVMIAGIGVAGLGLFLGGSALRPYLDNYPEFDIIILFSTLVLPFVSPVLMLMAGWNPTNYNISHCLLAGQESLPAFQLLFTRLVSTDWWSCTLASGLARILFLLIPTVIVAALVGMWWHTRRWVIAAAIFFTIFVLFYTSVFTNPGGLLTGSVGSLGYWLEQQEVQRGSQPPFYYLFVTPFYEFLPMLFSLLAIRLYLMQQGLNKIIGYWLSAGLLAWFAYSLVNWWFNAQAILLGQETSRFPGLLAALLFLAAAVLLWFFWRAGQIRAGLEAGTENGSLLRLFRWQVVCDFVPFMTWWLILTWASFSYAGEKMPWLSTHFVIPMAILTGWYFNEKLKGIDLRRLVRQDALLYLGLSIVAVIALLTAFSPIILGTVQLGNQQLSNLSQMGQVLGGLIAATVVIWLWLKVREGMADGRLRRAIWSLGIFAILSLLTIRFAYMASFPNADYVREFMVYAHGAPAVKNVVLDQVEELSQRLYGDNSIRVAYGGSGVPWPFTWYMRQYPNSVYFGENPSATLQESPVVIVGRSSWDQANSVLGNNYTYNTYTYLWWPMEDYRQINWNAILGDPNTPEEGVRRGLFNPNVRQAIWDIWFYRNYEKYDQTFNKTHTTGQWPLRDDLRLYIRNDVMAQLWNHGIAPTSVEVAAEPFSEGDLPISPQLVLHESGFPGAGPGELLAPRNMAVTSDGNIFVLDSGNQRVQLFDPVGALVTSFGGPGTGPGQFSADGQGPWGIAADEQYVYVADTWNHRVQKFTHAGDFVGSFGQAGDISQAADQGLGVFFGPRDIKLMADGRLLVSDTGNHRVQIMDRDGNFLGQVGGANGMSGAGMGLFYEPVGLALDPNGFLYVADTWNGRVQQFTPQFFPASEWPVSTWAGNFSVNNKPYAAADSGGRIYVTDPENYRVLIFGPNGNYLGKFGQFGTDRNSLALPTGIFIDHQDNIYVADAGNNRILKYAPIFAPAFTPIEEEPAAAETEEDEMEEPVATVEGEEMEEPTAEEEPEEEATAVATPTVTIPAASPTPTEAD